MDLWSEINDYPMSKVLDVLCVAYHKHGDVLILEQEGMLTDGWRCNVSGNYINDLSTKGRPSGGPYAFVKKYLGLTDKQTFDWFRSLLGIKEYATTSQKKKQVSRKLPVIRYVR